MIRNKVIIITNKQNEQRRQMEGRGIPDQKSGFQLGCWQLNLHVPWTPELLGASISSPINGERWHTSHGAVQAVVTLRAHTSWPPVGCEQDWRTPGVLSPVARPRIELWNPVAPQQELIAANHTQRLHPAAKDYNRLHASLLSNINIVEWGTSRAANSLKPPTWGTQI